MLQVISKFECNEEAEYLEQRDTMTAINKDVDLDSEEGDVTRSAMPCANLERNWYPLGS